MNTRITLTCVLLVAACATAVGTADAKPQLHSPAAALVPVAPPTPARDMLVWAQAPDWVSALSSQIDVVYPFESACIDDWQSPSDYAITTVQWFGGYWNGTILGPVDYFVITVWRDDGTCYPGDMFYQEDIVTFTETGPNAAGYYAYSAVVPPILQDAGAHYWISIQAVMVFAAAGQWGWMTSGETWGCPMMQKFELLGVPDWALTDYPALAFTLYSDQTIPVESGTWGEVKAIYR